jgi:hypothetical protein
VTSGGGVFETQRARRNTKDPRSIAFLTRTPPGLEGGACLAMSQETTFVASLWALVIFVFQSLVLRSGRVSHHRTRTRVRDRLSGR